MLQLYCFSFVLGELCDEVINHCVPELNPCQHESKCLPLDKGSRWACVPLVSKHWVDPLAWLGLNCLWAWVENIEINNAILYILQIVSPFSATLQTWFFWFFFLVCFFVCLFYLSVVCLQITDVTPKQINYSVMERDKRGTSGTVTAKYLTLHQKLRTVSLCVP